MTEATLQRGQDTVTLPLVAEGAGVPQVGTDYGKPEAGAANRGSLNPRWSDFRSQLETFTLDARYLDSDAYDRARELADFIKSHGGGQDLVLNIDMPEMDDDMLVAPAPEQDVALELAYDPGETDWVDAELSLTRVHDIRGADAPPEHVASTPTATGDGPITLSDGSNAVTFERDVTVERSVGRPNASLDPSPFRYPVYTEKLKYAFDEFGLSWSFVEDAVSDRDTLVDMVAQPLGRSALTLDFNGLYGLGAMDVVPRGSGALRLVRGSAQEGWIDGPNLTLRRVLT